MQSACGRPTRLAERGDADAEYYRNEHDREDLSAGEGTDEGIWNDGEQECDDALILGLADILPDRL
jgi:hypothetical protein